MIVFRGYVFETNSSSVHAICMCMAADYEKWVNEKLYYDIIEDCLVTYEEAERLDKNFPYSQTEFYEGWEYYDEKQHKYIFPRFLTISQFFEFCEYAT